MQYLMLNKPPGCISARVDWRDRPTVYDHIPAHFPNLPHVGRLDFNTEGLLLFTDDGRLQQGLLNKKYAGNANPEETEPVEKVYHIKVKAEIEADHPILRRLEEPLEYKPGLFTAPAVVSYVAPRSSCTWLSMTITEGKHHQVRRICKREGLQIRKLRRVKFGPLELGDLKIRWCRMLEDWEIEALYKVALPEG